MRMLKLLRLMVFVVCIAAFASGCGGGGGGTAEEMPPVMECPQGQVGTYPDCTDPPPTDEKRIAAAREILANILIDARSEALAASSAAAAVQFHMDATADQIANALAQAGAAQAALTLIEGIVSGAADPAITLAQAQMAVTDAQAALADLTAAQSAAAAVQSAVEAVASQRQQMQADVIALTNNSSLIQLVRGNTLLSTALLADLEAARLNVGAAGATTRTETDTESCDGATAPCAIFPASTGTGATAVIGQRAVVVQGNTSNSTTPPLTGTGRFPYGFDLISADGATYVNAYTDITQTRINVRTRTNHVEDTSPAPDDGTTDLYENRDFPDTDYLIAGIWMTVGATIADSTISAFAYGNQPIATTAQTFCSGIEGTAAGVTTGATTRTCADTTVNAIAGDGGFVKDGQDVTATYNGDANGAYIAGGDTSYFTGNVSLTAVFQNPTGGTTDGEGSIQGAVTNIVAGGQSLEGSIELQTQLLGIEADRNTISPAFDTGAAVGVVDGKSFSGNWKGQFFGHRVTRSQTTETDRTDPTNITTTVTTTYSPQAPGSVAGTFFVRQLSNPAGSAAFIGSFGAHR